MWTHQPGSHRQEEGHKGVSPLAVLPLIFLSREGFSRSFPSSTVKSNFVYLRQMCSPLDDHDVGENPSSCDFDEIRTHAPTSEGFEVTNWTTGATGYQRTVKVEQ